MMIAAACGAINAAPKGQASGYGSFAGRAGLSERPCMCTNNISGIRPGLKCPTVGLEMLCSQGRRCACKTWGERTNYLFSYVRRPLLCSFPRASQTPVEGYRVGGSVLFAAAKSVDCGSFVGFCRVCGFCNLRFSWVSMGASGRGDGGQ